MPSGDAGADLEREIDEGDFDMKMLVVTLLITLLAACAPESNPNLGSANKGEDNNDDWSAEALEFDKVCNQASPSAAQTATVRLIVAKTGTLYRFLLSLSFVLGASLGTD